MHFCFGYFARIFHSTGFPTSGPRVHVLQVLVKQELHEERLLAHGALEGLVVGRQVTLQLHLGRERVFTEQASAGRAISGV